MLKRSMAMVVISGFALSSASAQMSLEEKEEKFIGAFITVNAFVYLQNGQTDYIFPQLKRADYIVSAKEISDEFEQNEFAAEKKYKNKTIEISGNVMTVRRGSGDDIVIDFKQMAKARLLPNMIDKVADLKKDQYVDLLCEGAYTSMVATADKCELVPTRSERAMEMGRKIAKTFLNGDLTNELVRTKEGVNVSAPVYLYSFKYMAAKVPDNSPCLDSTSYNKCNVNQYFPADFIKEPDFQKSYLNSMEKYHLPSLNW